MYLHLGRDVVVSQSDITGIFDLDNTTGSQITREFLNSAEKAGRVFNVSDELPKSFVVCGDFVYLSQLSPITLMKRAEANSFTFST